MATAPEPSPGKQHECEKGEPGTTSEEDMRCPVCLDLYQVPKLLPCGHLVCARCLVSWLQANAMPRTCPECRAPISEEELCRLPATMPPEEICEALPTELSMASLVAALRKLQAPNQCDKCQEEATCFCLTCSIKLCRDCRCKHAKFFNEKVTKAKAKREAAVEEAGTADLGMDADHPDIPYVALKHHRIEAISDVTPGLMCREQVERCQTHQQSDNWNVYFCDTHSKALCVYCIRAGLHVAPCTILTTEAKVAESRKDLRELQERMAREDQHIQEEYDRLTREQEEAVKRGVLVQKELDSMMDGMLQGIHKAKGRLTHDLQDSEGLCLEQRLRQEASLLSTFKSDIKKLFAMDGAEKLFGRFEDDNLQVKRDMEASPPNCQHRHHYHPTHTHLQHRQHSHQSEHLQEFRSIAETMNSDTDEVVDGLRTTTIDALYPHTTNYQDNSSSNADNPPSTTPTNRSPISDVD